MKSITTALTISFLLFNYATLYSQSPITELEVVQMPFQDNELLLAQELQNARIDEPPRFAVNIPVKITPATHGVWEEIKTDRWVWRLVIESKDAKSLNFGFGEFKMPPSGSFIMYNTDKSIIRGPFTPLDNEEHNQLWTPVILSDKVVLEVSVDAADKEDVVLTLDYVNHDFRGFGAINSVDKSGSCNIDVICGTSDGFAQNNAHRDIMRSVAVISTGGGTFCTGFLVNNANNDNKPYFMTADHCNINASNAASLVTYWLYENSTCRAVGSAASGNSGDGVLAIYNTGATFRASYGPSDMTLVELDDPVNPYANAYFAGWRRNRTLPTRSIGIHHPSTDEKRISYENDASCVTTYLSNTCDNTNGNHIRVEDWDIGTTEGGSSGSPLFDQNEFVVGQLHGGYAACGNDDGDWYGWFHTSWTGGGTNASRLKNWLDPTNSAGATLRGINANNTIPLPTNTTCARAKTVFCGFYNTGPIYRGNGATAMDATHAAWYKFIPNFNGTINVYSCNGGSDTRLSVWGGSCNALTNMGTNDDDCQIFPGGNLYASRLLNIPVTNGVPIYIEWDNRWSSIPVDFYIDGCPCPTNYSGGNKLIGAPSINTDYETSGAIESTQTINTGRIVDYDSRTAITLLGGFEVKIGATFHAFIDGCGNFFNEDTSSKDFLRKEPVETNIASSDELSMMVYPNPATTSFTVEYTINSTQEVRIYLSDFSGKIVRVFRRNDVGGGKHYQSIDFGVDLSQGFYHVILQTDSEVLTEKVIYQQK